MADNSPEFLIEGILPANEVHLLGGSSGSGKTTFMFQVLLAEWLQGNPIFDHVSHPVPYVYVSLDRSRSSVTRTLQRLGLIEQITRVVCQEDLPETSITAQLVIADVLKLYKDAKLIIVEGFQLLAGERGNGYTTVAKTLKTCARICSKYKLTIIGICHSPKMRIEDGFQHPREMLLGSVSWGAYSDTVIVLNLDESTGVISVNVMPRNERAEQHHMRFGENGRLELAIPASKRDAIALKIGALSEGRPVTRAEILQWARNLGIAVRTCDRAIKFCLDKAALDQIGDGIYERTSIPLPQMVQESDLTVEE